MCSYLYVCIYSHHVEQEEKDQPGNKVDNPARGQLNRENEYFLVGVCTWEHLVSRDGFSSPVPRRPAHIHDIQAEPGAYLRDSSRVPRRRPFIFFSVYSYNDICYCSSYKSKFGYWTYLYWTGSTVYSTGTSETILPYSTVVFFWWRRKNTRCTRFSLSMKMSRLTRDGTTEPVSRHQTLRRERRQGNIHFPCSADHEQDWQPYPVDPRS